MDSVQPGERTRRGAARRLLVLVTGLQGTGKSTIADIAAVRLGAAVLGHDWAMSGLRPFPQIQDALDITDHGHRVVGWSVLRALARAQLRRDAAVVLDGVARAPEINACRALTKEEGAGFVLVVTKCSDPDLHRSRIAERRRAIPNWYELGWEDVEQAIATWEEPREADLVLDAVAPLQDNEAAIIKLVDHLQEVGVL